MISVRKGFGRTLATVAATALASGLTGCGGETSVGSGISGLQDPTEAELALWRPVSEEVTRRERLAVVEACRRAMTKEGYPMKRARLASAVVERRGPFLTLATWPDGGTTEAWICVAMDVEGVYAVRLVASFGNAGPSPATMHLQPREISPLLGSMGVGNGAHGGWWLTGGAAGSDVRSVQVDVNGTRVTARTGQHGYILWGPSRILRSTPALAVVDVWSYGRTLRDGSVHEGLR